MLSAEKLTPARTKAGDGRWQATAATGEEHTALPSGDCRPYLLAVAGAGGLARRTGVAIPGGGHRRSHRKPVWKDDGENSALRFELPVLPNFLRIYCYDQVESHPPPSAANSSHDSTAALRPDPGSHRFDFAG